MISFIIFDTSSYMRDIYAKVIKKFLYTARDYYKIHEFSEYNCRTWSQIKKIEGKRIYLISTNIQGINGFDLARKIRREGDVSSPIIMFIEKGKRPGIKNVKDTMLLSVIEQNDKLIKELLESIETAYKISTTYSVLTFSLFDEVYRLPYNDIYFIRKNIHDDTVTIHTKDDTYMYYKSIKRMSEQLGDDARFIRCHRSCILNLYKVTSYNTKDNIVTFDDGTTINLISREHKKELAERLKKELTP